MKSSNGGSNEHRMIVGSDPEQDVAPTRFEIPPKRVFVVRKPNPFIAEIDETTVEAHLVQFSTAFNMVMFVDLEVTPNGPDTRVHRIIYGVEDVEEVFRGPIGSPTRISH